MDKQQVAPSSPRVGFESQVKGHLQPFGASDKAMSRMTSKEWHQLHDEELESVSLENTGIHIHNILRNPRHDTQQTFSREISLFMSQI